MRPLSFAALAIALALSALVPMNSAHAAIPTTQPTVDWMACLFQVTPDVRAENENQVRLSKKTKSRIARCIKAKPTEIISISIRNESDRAERYTQRAVTQEFLRRGCVLSSASSDPRGRCLVEERSVPQAAMDASFDKVVVFSEL